jgi:hypothetical protein
MYAVSSPRAVIKIEEKVKMTALLNTKADINVIITEVADTANLFILEIIPIKAKTFTGYNAQLIGIYREIDIQIGAIYNNINIFIIQKGAHSLLLEMPYWIQAGITFDYSDDAVHATIISDNAKLRARFKTLTPKGMEDWVKKAVVNILN